VRENRSKTEPKTSSCDNPTKKLLTVRSATLCLHSTHFAVLFFLFVFLFFLTLLFVAAAAGFSSTPLVGSAPLAPCSPRATRIVVTPLSRFSAKGNHSCSLSIESSASSRAGNHSRSSSTATFFSFFCSFCFFSFFCFFLVFAFVFAVAFAAAGFSSAPLVGSCSNSCWKSHLKLNEPAPP